MGRRGPRPQPSAILERKGSERAKRNPAEPKPPRAKAPTPPRAMSKDGKKVWRQLVKLLDAMGVLTDADLAAVERYCETLVLWRACRDFIAERGMVFPLKRWNPHKDNGTDERGEKRPPGGFEVVGFKDFPQVKNLARFDTSLLQLEREMGLTPSARTRIEADAPRSGTGGRPPGSEEDRNTEATLKGPRLRRVAGGAA